MEAVEKTPEEVRPSESRFERVQGVDNHAVLILDDVYKRGNIDIFSLFPSFPPFVRRSFVPSRSQFHRSFCPAFLRGTLCRGERRLRANF